jgi:hypothetical protein
MESYIYLNVLELLYHQKAINVKYITKRFNISYRHAQEHIIHTLLQRHAIDYNRKSDVIESRETWLDDPIFRYFKLKHMLINVSDAKKIQMINELNEEKRKALSFKEYFEFKNLETISEEKEATLWDRFKSLFT